MAVTQQNFATGWGISAVRRKEKPNCLLFAEFSVARFARKRPSLNDRSDPSSLRDIVEGTGQMSRKSDNILRQEFTSESRQRDRSGVGRLVSIEGISIEGTGQIFV
jgi:hypothetical protein